jgi:mono/diheme cytochrome c family protein
MTRMSLYARSLIAAVLALFMGTVAATRASAPAAGQQAGAPGYTDEQARRGKTIFTSSCSGCHVLDAASSSPARLPLAGSGVLEKWRTVGDLHSKVRRTMPANNAAGLGDDAYLDVVAFLLQSNGVRAGRAPLGGGAAVLHRQLLPGAPSAITPIVDLTEPGFYTAAQAVRGARYFDGNCTTCHTVSADNRPTDRQVAEGKRGVLFGGDWRYWPVNGPNRLQRWGSAWGLYNKIRQTMPAHDPGGLSDQTYADITAYLLQVLGVPAGRRELATDQTTLRSLMLNEPGFQRVFNGRDFTGIKFVVGANCRPEPAGCAQTEPRGAFAVENGTIVSRGTPEGYWYPDQRFLNFALRFDYRYEPVPGIDRDEEVMSNSGYLLFITDHAVWPKSIEIQGQHLGAIGAFGVNTEVKVSVDADARGRAIRPIGQWNSVEIVSKDGRVVSSLNGTVISTVTEHEFKAPGYIGFQSEGGVIQWRNIRIKPDGVTVTN